MNIQFYLESFVIYRCHAEFALVFFPGNDIGCIFNLTDITEHIRIL